MFEYVCVGVGVNVHSCVGHACGGSVRDCATRQLKAQLLRYVSLHLKPAFNNGNVYIYRIRPECWFKKPTFGRMVVGYSSGVTQFGTTKFKGPDTVLRGLKSMPPNSRGPKQP